MLFIWAMLREPRRGHGFVVLALLTYPAIVVAVLYADFSPGLLVAAHAAPMATLGMTLLTTGLLRGQWLATQERERANRLLLAREQAEAQLRLANDTLEQRVALRTAELRESIAGLESFNRTISHDLRGPLGGIAGVARLAREHVASGDSAAAERMLQSIADQAETSHKLVGALLAMAHSSDATLQREPVDTAALVLEVIESLRHTRSTERFAMLVARLPPVEADPELLRQVFVNLIGNALKFGAGNPHPHIEIGARSEAEGGPTFHVRDNGVGFAPGDAKRLFQPFQRLHGQRFEGFGIGLSIVKRIVERHGGAVWAEANTGAGATFFFTLQPGVQGTALAARDRAFVRGLLQRANATCGAALPVPHPQPSACCVGGG
jgi:signal transduction histidine kinase